MEQTKLKTGNFKGWRKCVAKVLVPSRDGDGLASDTAWNAVSNAAAAGMTFVMLILASRVAGAYWCGVAALGLAMSQQLFPIGNFTMGSYQASDISERRKFADYVSAKALSVSAMLAAGALWLALDWRGRDRAMAFIPMLIYQASDAFSNAFFSRYQQKGRLDAACRVRFAKTVAFAMAYTAVLLATRNPLPAMAAAAITHVALFFVLDMPLLNVFGPLRPRLPGRQSLAILASCAPLAANSLMSMLVNNAPRFAIDAELGAETLAAFSALFMVSFAVAVCADFLMNPQVVRLAASLRDGDRAAAIRTIRSPLVAILALGAAGVATASLIGVPVLSRLFGIDLSGHTATLCLLLCGGMLLALYQLSQTVLVILRRQAWGLPGMLLAAAMVIFLSHPMVARLGLMGAALSYLAAVSTLAIMSGTFAMAFLRQAMKGTAQP